jgi:hypothetical protein
VVTALCWYQSISNNAHSKAVTVGEPNLRRYDYNVWSSRTFESEKLSFQTTPKTQSHLLPKLGLAFVKVSYHERAKKAGMG